MFTVCNLDNHPSCGYTTTDQRDPAAGDVIHLTYWVIYAQAVEFKPVMSWEIDGAPIQPHNAAPANGNGQYNYSSTYNYTLPRESNITIGCQTMFVVQNTDKDTGVATNHPSYNNVQKLVIDVKGK